MLPVYHKRNALEVMIGRIKRDDVDWKVVDLEAYVHGTPDEVFTDEKIIALSDALKQNTRLTALKLPENAGYVTWNAMWPLFESIKLHPNISKLLVSSSGFVFGHDIRVFLTNKIIGFFEDNLTIRSFGEFSQPNVPLSPEIRTYLNRNILLHFVPQKIGMLQLLWERFGNSSGPLSQSASDALSLVFQFDEHLSALDKVKESHLRSMFPLLVLQKGFIRKRARTVKYSQFS